MMRRTALRWMVAGAGFLLVAHATAASAVQGAPAVRGTVAVQAAPAQLPSSVQKPATSNEIPVRLRYLEGTVTVERAAADETEAASINLPLGAGDRVSSSDDGRVELQFEDGTSIWMDANTALDLVSLRQRSGPEGAILRLWMGSVFVDRPEPVAGTLQPLRFDALSGAVRLDEPGLFRIDLDQDQSLWLSVYDGAAILDAGGLTERVTAGQRTLAQLDSAPARAVPFNTAEADGFSSWRDERMLLYASSYQYVSERDYVPDNIVRYAADLEPYGSWSYNPTYASWYWKPYAAVSWSPYRDGRWVYTYGGWAWVPAAPWGYVTTHYGRWDYSDYGGWRWFPGRVWTPASVRWYVGSGYVGWVPLNYYGRPAVSFGIHFGGGGFGASLGYGGYYPYYGNWGYGGYYPYYPYYGNWGYGGYYGFGGHYGYGGRYRYGGRYGYGGRYRYGGRYGYGGRYDNGYNRPYGGRRGDAVQVGPIGSASGTGRVVDNRGYSSGLADAWTVVPSEELGNRNVGRVAVKRSALPRGLDQGSKALVSGTLRARRPASLIPRQAPNATAPTTLSGRRAVPSGGTSQIAPGAKRDAGNTPAPGAQRRSAVPRLDRATLGSGGVRSSTPTTGATPARSPSATRRAVPNGSRRVSPGSPTVAPRTATRSPTVAPRSSGQVVPGATRRAMTPTATRSRTPASTRSRTPSSATTRYPTVRSRTPTTGGATRYPTRGRAAPSTGAVRYPTTRRAVPPSAATPRTMTPSRSVRRPSAGRAPVGSGGRSSPSVRSATPSRSAPTVRSAPRARPSGGRSGPSVRAAAPPRSGGGSPRKAVRRSRGRGGAPQPDGDIP